MSVEILAPGGSKEAIYAGLYSGADAVYTGTEHFSARAFADNPSVEDLCRVLDFAHLHGKKIYLTVNTLLTEEELEGQLYDLLRPLYESGLDAVIVQDFGVMDHIRQSFPGLPLHASTQMSLLTGEGAELLKSYGVTRIVPARELSLAELQQMRKETSLEIEVFVHGALCYCYSGQCLLSQVIGGRSGNRGMCAQPCRLPYEAEGKKAGYLLSPKDLCALSKVGKLIEAGVDSFKIEGRMKKPAYTAYTSHLYRLYADAYLSGREFHEKEITEDVRKLADIYNRGGFSGGYLFEPSKKNIIYPVKNGHFGVRAGTVTKVNKNTAEYRLNAEINAQDVLEFRDEKGACVYEYTIKEGVLPPGTVTARYKKGSPIKPGQNVYRTKNNHLLDEIADLIGEGKKNCKVKLRGSFRANAGERASLTLFHGDTECTVYGVTAEPAKGRPVLAGDIEKRLRKTGESEFEFEELEVTVGEAVFIPLGSIAAMRRQGFEEMTRQLLEPFRRKAESGYCSGEFEEKETGFSGKKSFVIVGVTDFCQIKGVKLAAEVNAYNTRFHLKLAEFMPEEWEKLPEACGEFYYYVSLPVVLRRKNIDYFLQLWNKHGAALREGKCAGVIINSIEALPILPKMGLEKGEILAAPALYMWNRRTEKIYRELGITGHIYMAYGRTPVMTTEGCVRLQLGGCQTENCQVGSEEMSCHHAPAVKTAGKKHPVTICTPKKDEFTVVNYCDYCYNVMYEKNAAWHEPGVLAGLPEISFTFENAEEAGKVLTEWNFLS
ncbi:MAG: U32 family peptidase [Roseburia sp.]|nr:U32 family peptidase [Roseburia sp.]